MKYRVRTSRHCGFYTDLDALFEKLFKSEFFDNLDTIRDNSIAEQKRLERYRARRVVNLTRAYPILLRLRKVAVIDLYEMTKSIGPNFFGEKTLQFNEVKRLYEKKARIVWFLLGLYRYLAFDYEGPGWSAKRGFHYSRHRKHYLALREKHLEKVRQKKWDLKRAKVRARRNQDQGTAISDEDAVLFALRRGLGFNVPMPSPILENEGVDPIDEHLDKNTNWDD